MKLLEELKYRGMLKDNSNEELAKEYLDNSNITFYIGFDPSASSLTIGHLVQIIRIKILQKYGHKSIILIGGATGLIGDPKETEERKLLSLEQSLKNAELIKKQIENLFIDNKPIIVNNYDWISKINIIEFLRDYGKFFNINYMLSKETISKRLETGISFTEFTYMILQAIDWLYLYKNYNCNVQFGGSDQWGNITAGLELIRKKEPNAKVLALSSPLLLKADGTKFGKSESGTLWLDKELTSPYEMYQYFINASDKDVITYLKLLTLLSKEEIEEYENKLKLNPEKREAQERLGKEIITLLYGENVYKEVLNITKSLFHNDIKDLTNNEMDLLEKGITTININENINIVELLVNNLICSSKREAREFINNNAISINGKKINDIEYIISKEDTIKEKHILIRKGKKDYYLVKFK